MQFNELKKHDKPTAVGSNKIAAFQFQEKKSTTFKHSV